MPLFVQKIYHENKIHFLIGDRNNLGVYADNGDEKWGPTQDRYLGPVARALPESQPDKLLASATPMEEIPLDQSLQHGLNVQAHEIKRIAREGQIGRVKGGKVVPAFARFEYLLEKLHGDYDTLKKRIPTLQFPWDRFDETSACKNVIRTLLQEVTELESSKAKDDKLYVASALKVITNLKLRLVLLGSPFEIVSERPEVR